ncbi:MAG TPA: hypothetical protein VJB87_01920 [Candidatus Nanoarchaeia archaeon]|nr:hypothetical protein [Candidatus Nanoarchaeia archaeon]
MTKEDILKKYQERLNHDIELDSYQPSENFSREYNIFRKESLSKEVTIYEQLCKQFANVITIKLSEDERNKLQESIRVTHLDITPEAATSFGATMGIILVMIGIAYITTAYFVFNQLQWFLPTLFLLIGVFSIKPLGGIPHYLANRWRLKASNQMVLCILYIVMYMRHTSNLEHAVKFAGEHIGSPLNLDLRKIFWDIETEKYATINESLDNYLEQWKAYNSEFVESFHLIQGSLFEPTESRRQELLEKGLDIMIEGTYDKMLHFAHNLKNPITMLHMLGIILPILGLVIFPLIGSFLSGAVRWYHLAVLYDVFLPLFVIILGKSILDKRPTGYGSYDPVQQGRLANYYQPHDSNLKVIAWIIALLFIIIGYTPFIINSIDPKIDFIFLGGSFLDFKNNNGPYGIGALLLSLLVPFGIALAISMYYKKVTKEALATRQEIEKLEQEFSGALFLLGNKIADGIPVEIAFDKVADNMETTATGKFFQQVSSNIRKLGMNVQEAIFGEEKGAIQAYPSPLIESSMKVLVEGSKKGSSIAAKSMITISIYVEKIRKVNERLNDLLSDVISSMRSQISFLTPVIAGIVVGVSSMVVTLINRLGEQFNTLEDAGGFSGVGAIANIINIKDVIPGFQFQIVVGIYVLEITIILIYLANTIERGIDPVWTKADIGKSLSKAMGLYFVISLIGIILFNMLSSAVSIAVTTSG